MTSLSSGPDWPSDASQARRLLGVPSDADARDIRRAWRSLARRHHPDRGGDTTTFLALQAAYRLATAQTTETVRPDRSVARGTPSRPASTTTPSPSVIEWDDRPPADGDALDEQAIAMLIGTTGRGHVHATSRAPGSLLNRWASQISGHDAASLSIRPSRDDRGRIVCLVTITARTRATRRALESARLPEGWLRRRAPSTTTLTVTRPADDNIPDDAQGITATWIAHTLGTLLSNIDWPLSEWFLRASATSSPISNPQAR